ncbi:MAG TPA: PQQ-binding-like beta-propeller repeat protein [Dehalococcoidia bacterium]|nr:PQQ-binding-like beta-propeller repeat protein [Dehalococcoidia bacterium]
MLPLRRSLLLIAPAVFLGLLAIGCTSLAQPQGWAAPVVTDAGYLTSLHHGKLELVDKTTKAITWEFPPAADTNLPVAYRQTKLNGIYGTPAVSGETVIVGAYNGKVYALKLADGTPIWPKPVDTGESIVGNVAIDNGVAYVGNSAGQLYAIKVADGSLAWNKPFKAGDRIWSAPVIDNGVIYVTSMDRHVYAIRAENGAEIWKNGDSGGAITSTPSLDGGHLYFGAFDKHLYALDTQQNGRKLWQSSPGADNWLWGHPLVQNGMVYTGSLAGTVYGVSAADGKVQWQQKLGTSIRGRPALAQGVLVVADRNGRVEGYDPASGAPKWARPLELASHALGDLVAQSDGSVLVQTDGGTNGTRLVSIDPLAGTATDVVRP